MTQEQESGPVEVEMTPEIVAFQEKVRSDYLLKVTMQFDRIKDHPQMLVLVAHGLIELMANVLIDSKCKNAKRITENRRDFSHSAKLIILNELGIIDDGTFKVLDWFRDLRNRAAHDPLFEVKKIDLQNMKSEFRDSANFHSLCMLIMLSLWNEHKDIFGPIFAPTIMGAEPVAVIEGTKIRKKAAPKPKGAPKKTR